MRVLLIAVFAALGLSLSGCNLVFKLPTRQGNVIDQKQLDQLKLGMTRQQVTYLMGTPIAASPFRNDQWQYTGYYKSPRGVLSTRTVSLYFDDKDTLTRMEGVAAAAKDVPAPDAKAAAAIFKAQKKEATDNERSQQPPIEPGINLPEPGNNP